LDRDFLVLRGQVKESGLLDPTYGYYVLQALFCFGFLALSIMGALRVPELSVLAAALIAFGSVQVGLLGHDAGHRAVFRSSLPNVVLGSMCWSLVLGIGFWFWNHRHLRHHAHVNDLHADPDVKWTRVVVYRHDAARGLRGQCRRLYEVLQGPGYALGLAFSFRLEGWNFALRRLRGRRQRVELALLGASLALWLTPCIAIGPRWLLTYVGAQIMGGLYLGAAIAPNHKGMATWPAGSSAGFVERQVLSSRNVRPGWLVDFVLGGLNYQIEHHLFPGMSRRHLHRARDMVRRFCAEQGLV
jgi:fatty acid desaturase